jgi:hypothetical protein
VHSSSYRRRQLDRKAKVKDLRPTVRTRSRKQPDTSWKRTCIRRHREPQGAPRQLEKLDCDPQEHNVVYEDD